VTDGEAAREAALALQSMFLREASERAASCQPVTQAEIDDRVGRVEAFKREYPDAHQSIAVLEDQIATLRAAFARTEAGADDDLW